MALAPAVKLVHRLPNNGNIRSRRRVVSPTCLEKVPDIFGDKIGSSGFDAPHNLMEDLDVVLPVVVGNLASQNLGYIRLGQHISENDNKDCTDL